MPLAVYAHAHPEVVDEDTDRGQVYTFRCCMRQWILFRWIDKVPNKLGDVDSRIPEQNVGVFAVMFGVVRASGRTTRLCGRGHRANRTVGRQVCNGAIR